jgi:transposase
MFLRANVRKKNGKTHRYFSVVENRRLSKGVSTQRQVLYLGEINDSQEAAWRKTLSVFDEQRQSTQTLALFPDDQPLPVDAINALQVKLDQMRLERPRAFGNCWLGCTVWRHLELDRFWREKLGAARGGVPWEKVLELLVINRLIDPGSEFRLHRQWFDRSAMDELLAADFAVASKDRLYRCLDLLLPHKDEVFKHLKRRWQDLFNAEFDVLLYDLTSTYFEGLCELIPKAKHGYSRDGRPDCRQVVIALIVTPDGLPLAYEVMPGNTSDKTTLPGFLKHIEERYGKARRTWVMDRGIPTEEVLAEMRAQSVQYLVGTPKGRLTKLEKSFLPKPWQSVREGVQVKLLEESGELLVLARSADRVQKEHAIRRKKLKRLYAGLKELLRQAPSRDQLLQKLGVLKHAAGRAVNLVEIIVPHENESVLPETFRWKLRLDKFKTAARRDGHYILRTNLNGEKPEVLWQRYIQLTEIEAAFKCLKSELAIRPIYHQLESRVEAHIFVAFLAYALLATLRKRLELHAPGLTPMAVLEKLATIKLIDVWLPTSDGRWLIMPRYTQPECDQQIVLDLLKMKLPPQPPPRIRASQVALGTTQAK